MGEVRAFSKWADCSSRQSPTPTLASRQSRQRHGRYRLLAFLMLHTPNFNLMGCHHGLETRLKRTSVSCITGPFGSVRRFSQLEASFSSPSFHLGLQPCLAHRLPASLKEEAEIGPEKKSGRLHPKSHACQRSGGGGGGLRLGCGFAIACEATRCRPSWQLYL